MLTTVLVMLTTMLVMLTTMLVMLTTMLVMLTTMLVMLTTMLEMLTTVSEKLTPCKGAFQVVDDIYLGGIHVSDFGKIHGNPIAEVNHIDSSFNHGIAL